VQLVQTPAPALKLPAAHSTVDDKLAVLTMAADAPALTASTKLAEVSATAAEPAETPLLLTLKAQVQL
jgi:hypothetical protein